MLLALDVGNSNVTIGAFNGEDLAGRWRLRTIQEQTADEWGILLRNLFALGSLDIAKVDGIIIGSVVPPLDSSLALMAQRQRADGLRQGPGPAAVTLQVAGMDGGPQAVDPIEPFLGHVPEREQSLPKNNK